MWEKWLFHKKSLIDTVNEEKLNKINFAKMLRFYSLSSTVNFISNASPQREKI